MFRLPFLFVWFSSLFVLLSPLYLSNFHSICSIFILLVQTHFCGWQTSDKVERQTLISAKCSRKVSNHLPPKYIKCKIKYINDQSRHEYLIQTIVHENFIKNIFWGFWSESKVVGKYYSVVQWLQVLHCERKLCTVAKIWWKEIVKVVKGLSSPLFATSLSSQFIINTLINSTGLHYHL